MDFIQKFKSFFAKKKETYEIPFDRVIEMMKSEEMFAKAVKEQDGNVVYENSTYFNYLLNLVYKSGIENIISLMNSDVKSLNKGEVENYVVDKKLPNWSYLWLRAGFGKENFNKHQTNVIKGQEPSVSLRFAKHIESADIEQHSQIVLDRGSGPLSKYFAQIVNEFSYNHLEKYVDYLVNYVSTGGSVSSDAEILQWVSKVFTDEAILGEYDNELAKDTKENKKLKDYIMKYTNAKLKRRDLDSIKADDIVIAERF